MRLKPCHHPSLLELGPHPHGHEPAALRGVAQPICLYPCKGHRQTITGEGKAVPMQQ